MICITTELVMPLKILCFSGVALVAAATLVFIAMAIRIILEKA